MEGACKNINSRIMYVYGNKNIGENIFAYENKTDENLFKLWYSIKVPF